jgi:adenylylsulfate kinase-like enzyme
MVVLWITGLSAVGKSTVAKAYLRAKKDLSVPTVLLDGDAVRELFGGDLGYDEQSRNEHIKRIQRLAKFLSDQGLDVVVAALYSNEQILSVNRTLFLDYFEVYLKANLNCLKLRENKSLYTKAEKGEIVNVVGVDIKWHEPKFPDLVIQMDQLRPPLEIAEEIVSAIVLGRNR